MDATTFLQNLQHRTRQLQVTVSTDFAPLDPALLNFKPAPDSWSILECLEHLNRYSRYYNARLTRALATPAVRPAREFSYSWLGRKSIEAVRPGNRQPQKTLGRMNPNHSQLTPATVEEFLRHQTELLTLLTQARAADLNRKAIPVEFFRLLRLSLGDALEFVVAHQERHVHQAGRVRQQLRLELSI